MDIHIRPVWLYFMRVSAAGHFVKLVKEVFRRAPNLKMSFKMNELKKDDIMI